MATLEKIRNRSGLLLGIIGFALLAFVLGDLFNSGGSLFNSSRTEIGVVDGEPIQYQTYLAKEQELTEVYKRSSGGNISPYLTQQIRTQVWEDLVRQIIMRKEYETLGIDVSSQELFEMIQGKELDPIIQNIFANPQTGQVNKTQILQFLKAVNEGTIDPANRAYWEFLERDIYKRRKQAKYNTLISKGLNITTAEAEADFKDRQYMVDFEYVVQPYSSIKDSEVEVSDSEIAAYYDKHEEDFKQEASRDLEYVSFEISPSEDDRQESERYITDLKESFAKTEDDARFVSLNSDAPFQDRFFKKGDLDASIDSILFGAEVGYIHGPYEDNDAFKLAKLIDRQTLPDSVEARHILIRVSATTNMEAAKAKADSLKTAIEKGSDFAELAKEFGTDATKDKGGDLGWFGQNQMVKPFNDAVFAAAKGDLMTVETQFGVHVIEVTGVSAKSDMIKVAFLERAIEASTKTFQDVYATANKFASSLTDREQFEAAIKEQGLSKRVAPRLREIDNRVAGLQNPREMVKWAYKEETTVGSFSPVFEFGNKYVVATLVRVRKAGVTPLAEVSNEIARRLRKDKKAEKIIADLGAVSSLEAMATSVKGEVKTATNITFASRQIPGAGMEPAVIGTAVTLKKDAVSKPIQGNNGVYVLKVTTVTNPTFENPVVTANKQSLERNIQQRAGFQSYNALKEKANVEDKRGSFL